ncbi:hypothetical protein [Baekduia sp.]|jgi:hypothetical protein|uniref:hypothetical protein n=1 Tax=Baekduia sp. TaxID=2600305 RepID=UPI002DFBE537|nr:hypothetical protein [Baekduia sp.]
MADRKTSTDVLLAEFFKAAQPHVAKAASPDPPLVPEDPEKRRPGIPLLYHYTTLDGLTGITDTSSIWASDARYMNDASEMSYAAELIETVIAEVLAEVDDQPLRSALPTRPGFGNAFNYAVPFGPRPFVACFCEAEDLLSQWRGYGGDDSGISLGIDVHG